MTPSRPFQVERLHVRNYRALRDFRMTGLRPVTALVGPNGSGSITSALPIACRFVELALQPISFQATFGVEPDLLKKHVGRHIDEAIVLLTTTGLLRT